MMLGNLVDVIGPGAPLAGNNVWTGFNTFSGGVNFGVQAFTLNGATQTVLATAGSFIDLSGSTGGSTIALPASPTSGTVYFVRSVASVAVTLSGNGHNIDNSASQAIPGAGLSTINGATIIFDGTQWCAVGSACWGITTLNGLTTAGTLTTSGGANIGHQLARINPQSFVTNGGTQSIVAANGSKVVISGSTGGSTFNLPAASLTTGQEFVIVNNSSVSITISGNGNNIQGSASLAITSQYSVRIVSWNGSTWDLIGSVGT